MDPFVAWLKSTTISAAIVQYPWVWPMCETIHFIGLALVLGIAGFFDLRLMGFMKRVPVRAARDLMPLAIGGFLLNLMTGVTFFIGHPEQYVSNPAFGAKVFFLVLAGLNAMFFETTVGARTINLGAGDDPPTTVKFIGAISLVSWLGVLYCGRMLPFIGDAF